MSTEVTIVFVAVVGARFLVPLLIPRFPLPSILACLVLDGIDQTIFQAFGFDPPGYQGYDKAMDVYYLAIAYLSTLQELDQRAGRRIARFLYFYRLVGVVAFELSGNRALLVDLPQHVRVLLHRLRGRAPALGPARASAPGLDGHRRGDLGLRQAPPGVLDPHRAARLHRHLARTCVAGPALVVAAVVALRRLWFVVRPRLPPATGPGGSPRTRCRRRWTPPPNATAGRPRTCACGRPAPWRRSCSSGCSPRSTRWSCPALEVSSLRTVPRCRGVRRRQLRDIHRRGPSRREP